VLTFFCRAIEHQVQQNLDPSVLSPYIAIDEYQRFASSLAYSTNTPPNTRVSPDGMCIDFKEFKLDVKKWRVALADLAARVERGLEELCDHQEFGLSMPEMIPDDWTNTDRSYGWTGNPTFIPGKHALLHHMLKHKQLATVDAEGKLVMKAAAMWDFLARSAQVNSDLALLCFFVNNQSTRISEFVEHKVTNSTRARTCFYDDHSQAIWLVTRRLKNKQESFVPLKCPPLVTKLLAKYLLIVRPVEAHIAYHVQGSEARTLYKEYMWVQNCEPLTKTGMYSAVPDFLERTIGSRIGIHDYRQIAVELARVFLGSEMEVELEELDVLAAMRGHTAETARVKYASETGHLPRLSSDLLLRHGRMSEKWWEVTGFKPNTPSLLPLKARQQLRARMGPTARTGDWEPSNESAAIFDPQVIIAALTDMLHKSFQKLESGLESRLRELVIEAFGAAYKDTANHRSYTPIPTNPPTSASCSNIGDDSFGDPILYDSRADFDDIYEPEQPTADNHISATVSTLADPPPPSTMATEYSPTQETRDYLHHLLGQHFPDIADPQFKSPEQMQAVDMAMAREENFVLVLPTGAGKSLVFTLPPFNEPDFRTYVIVPNKALLTDHIERCNKLGLRVSQWRSQDRSVPDEAQIVFLALETATSQTFRM